MKVLNVLENKKMDSIKVEDCVIRELNQVLKLGRLLILGGLRKTRFICLESMI